MLKKTLAFIQQRTGWRTILLLLAAALLLMFLMNGTKLPFSNPTIVEKSGGLPILDMRISFSPDDAYQLFTALGTGGRRAYLCLHLGPDMLFPACYALVFAFLSAWFLVRLWPPDHRLQWLSMIPLISGIADLMENISLAFANMAFPTRIDWLVWFGVVFNRIKFSLLPVGLVFLLIILAIWIIRKNPAAYISERSALNTTGRNR